MSRLLYDPRAMLFLNDLLQDRHKAQEVTAEEIRANLAAIGRADRRNLVDETGAYKRLSEIDEELARAVEGYKVTDKGVEVKLASRLRAWELLAELNGMKKLQVEVSHPVDKLLTEDEQRALESMLGKALEG
jgi:hypothetical protein